MKKYIILLMVGILEFANSSADIYTSVSKKIEIKKEKKENAPIKLHWYGKAGINVGVTDWNLWNYHDIPLSSNTIGLDINAGFYSYFRPSNPSKFYWGADINIGLNHFHLNEAEASNGLYYCDSQNFFVPYINIAPQLGWTNVLSNTTRLDIHLEPAGMYINTKVWDYTYYYRDDNEYYGCLHDEYLDGFSKIGIGIWHKNMIFDISYRQPWLYFPGTITFGVGVQF